MASIKEPSRSIPVIKEVDVVVCGGGPAGISAAISSARAGAKTILIEQHGCLGGIWTVGALTSMLDSQDKEGIMFEILERLTKMGARSFLDGKPTYRCDVEKLKLLLDDLCAEAGVQVRLYTRVAHALVNDQKRLTHAILESKSGREAVAAKCFIDCTGDGDLSALAGCHFDIGHPETGLHQPMTLMALVTGLVQEEIKEFYPFSTKSSFYEVRTKLKTEMERGGHSPSYALPTLKWIRDDLFMLMANHEYKVKGTNSDDLSNATIHARKELHNLVDGLRSLGGVWKNIRIVATGSQIGVRESRRILGRYVITAEDIEASKRHEDAVCRVTFGMDIHSPDPKKGKAFEVASKHKTSYDVPLRALIAKDVDGLMMAGRCISGDFFAHSSYRVTGNAVVLGEAAGRTAALAALTNRLPHQVSWNEVMRK